MTAARYQEQVLDGALKGFYEEVKEGRGCVDSQQDGAPSHTAKTTIAWFKKAGIPLAEHPAQSPDINPIEPVWHKLKKILHSQRHASTPESLKSAICAAWDALPQEVIDQHNNKLPDVVEARVDIPSFDVQYSISTFMFTSCQSIILI
jgi:transposase